MSHLLAVSGQNVTLLALLALPVLAAFGIPLRERLVWILGLIAVYVPLAGAEPSIQRAGVMGAAGLVATLSGRRSSRLFALILALIVTLAVDPSIAAEIGWQLSFAAVTGIFVLAGPLRRSIAVRIGTVGLRRAFAEGAAVTLAATVATAPLIAFHFETFSTTSLLANLLAMPAVAPAMWLGMASAAAAQVPGAPVEVLNFLNAHLLAYIAQVASWCAAPAWSEIEVRLGPAGLLASYFGLTVGCVICLRLARHRRLMEIRRRERPTPSRSRSAWLLVAVCAVLVAVGAWISASTDADGDAPLRAGLRVTMLDVGQGDAILLQPAQGPAMLVDGGPPGEGLAGTLEAAGVERLGAVIATHDQSDHVGGLEELLGRFPITRLVYARLGRRPLGLARAAGAITLRVAASAKLSAGDLHLEVLWPPRERLAEPIGDTDPNQQALVLLARWHDFSMLLAADAEAEAVPLEPGPVDVLKVAHHGSEDAGLAALLERAGPRLALISVGEDNPHGHPTPSTLATLAAHGLRILRTDRDGEIVLQVRRRSIVVETGG